MRMCVRRGGRIRPPDLPPCQGNKTKKVEGLMRCRVVGRANNNANVNGGVVYANAVQSPAFLNLSRRCLPYAL